MSPLVFAQVFMRAVIYKEPTLAPPDPIVMLVIATNVLPSPDSKVRRGEFTIGIATLKTYQTVYHVLQLLTIDIGF